MATVQQLDPIHIDMQQSMADILRLQSENAQSGAKGNAKVRLVLEDGSVYPLQGTLQFSEMQVDESTGSVTLRATLPTPMVCCARHVLCVHRCKPLHGMRRCWCPSKPYGAIPRARPWCGRWATTRSPRHAL